MDTNPQNMIICAFLSVTEWNVGLTENGSVRRPAILRRRRDDGSNATCCLHISSVYGLLFVK